MLAWACYEKRGNACMKDGTTGRKGRPKETIDGMFRRGHKRKVRNADLIGGRKKWKKVANCAHPK